MENRIYDMAFCQEGQMVTVPCGLRASAHHQLGGSFHIPGQHKTGPNQEHFALLPACGVYYQ